MNTHDTNPHDSAASSRRNRDQRISRDLRVSNPSGLHLRAAAEIVKLALRFTSSITLTRQGSTANARSILKIASLAAATGDTITATAEGPDAAQALDAMANLFNSGFFDEPDVNPGLILEPFHPASHAAVPPFLPHIA